MSGEDIHTLKLVALSDKAVLEVVLVTAYFNFVNRIAQALGVELEGDDVRG
jgi:alkylhydroperoxidase family enzyme